MALRRSTPEDRKRYETYWQAYFDHLDQMTPLQNQDLHCIGLRDMTVLACKDGVFFLFNPSPDLTFTYKYTPGTVAENLRMLTRVVGGLRAEPFPARGDLGPICATTIEMDDDLALKSESVNVLIHRAVWFLDSAMPEMTVEDAIDTVEYGHATPPRRTMGDPIPIVERQTPH
jgi:hypothetical protein